MSGNKSLSILILAPCSRPQDSAWSVAKEFVNLGHSVIMLDYRNAILSEKIYSQKFDMILIIKGELINPLVIKQFKESYRILWLWDFNSIEPSPYAQELAIYCNITITTCKPWTKFFRNKGIRSEFIKQAADIDLFKESRFLEEEDNYFRTDVSFIGSNKGYRSQILKELSKHFHVGIWGENWQNETNLNWYGTAYLDQFSKVCFGAKIMLNMLCYDEHPTFEETISQRLYRLAACASTIITDDPGGIENIYIPNEQIFVINNWSKIVDMVKYLLDKNELRFKLRRAAWLHTIHNHTYKHRINEILELYNKRQ